MTMDAVRKRIDGGENATTAFVRDLHSAKLIGRTVCALLNGDGGALYCGVSDDGEVIGLTGEIESLAQKLELDLKEAISPRALFSASLATLNDRELVIIEVPRGKDGPYILDGGIWLRKAGKTVAADIDTLRTMLRLQADAPIRWERRVSPAMTAEDLDRDEIRATVRDAEDANRFVFSARDDDLAVLKDLSVYTNGEFTQAGDILFSRAPSRRHPQCRVQLVRFTGDKSDDSYEDNRWFEGPLVRVFDTLLSAVTAAVPVRSVFLSDGGRRVDRPDHHLDAIREGLVNAFVHRDYSAYSGGLRVSIYASRIEIWNSGRLTGGLTPFNLRHDHPSILVNPDIAQVFYLREWMERIGRGTEKIIEATQKIGAPPPQWRDIATGVTLTLFAATPTTTGKPPELNDRQNQLLLDLQPGDKITPKAYRDRYATQVTARQARRDLEDLAGLGWLRREGQSRSIIYRLP